MARLMDIGLEKLKDIVLGMASLSEKTVVTSVQAYSSGSASREIRDWSEDLRKMQEEVSELSIEIIARYQPVASDLRFVKSCMEISYGFQRIGRYAYDIDQVLEMFGNLSECDHSVVETTASATREMMRMSIEAFTKRDIELARRTRKLDDFVDQKYRDYVASAIKNPKSDIRCSMSATLILRYLERIADHCSSIGDSVFYIVSGEKSPRKSLDSKTTTR
ncbi:MAG: phosphate signaling complex PhoU family protein [Nitrososphaerales archaeon]